jgi:hypothetical protein
MRFYITAWNHHPRAHDLLLDIVLPIAAGLRDLGHDVEMGTDPPRRGVTNVVVEFFRERMPAAQLMGLDYVLVGTEFPDGAGFNRARTKTWRRRYHHFKLLAQHARAIWVVVDDAAAAYGALGPAPAVQVGLGWSQSLESPPRSEPATFDICAYGKMKVPQRQEALRKLSTRLRVEAIEFESKARRDALLRSSLFCYGFRPHANVTNASTSRIVASLMQGVPVLQERVAGSTPFVDAMEVIDGPDEVLDRWDELLARRGDILQRQLAAWRQMPAAEIMAEAVAVMRPAPSPSWTSWTPIAYLKLLLNPPPPRTPAPALPTASS